MLGYEGEDGLGRHMDQPREAACQLLKLARRHVHRANADGKPGAVVDERCAVAIFDDPARRQDLDAAQAVVLGLGQVLLTIEDL